MKKLLMVALSLTLAVTLAVSGTIAYLTSEDGQVNVMTLGNVSIKQIEKERIEQLDTNTADTNIQDFSQDLPLYPAVYGEISWAKDAEGNQVYQAFPTGGSSALFNDDIKNVRDKFVHVENDGKTDAYVRTIFAFEAGDMTAEDFADADGRIHINYNTDHWDWTAFSEANQITIDGTKYYVVVATYKGNAGTDGTTHPNGVLPKGETTRPSLLQVFLDKVVDNDLCASFGETYDIIALSQAVQAAGFADAATALSEAFDGGEAIDMDKVQEWLAKLYVIDVANPEELAAALAAAEKGDTIQLAEGVDFGVVTLGGELEDVTILGAEGAKATFTVPADAKLTNVTLKKLDINPRTNVNGINIASGAVVTNLKVEDSDFIGTGNSADKSTGNRGVHLGGNVDSQISFTGCTFDGVSYGLYSFGHDKLSFEKCHFKSPISWAILYNGTEGNSGDLSITNCTFEQCVNGIAKPKTINAPDGFTFTGNTLIHPAPHNPYNYFQVTATVKNISNNTKDGAAWEIGVAEGVN